MIEISKELTKSRKASIDGYVFTVKKLGAAQELTLSQIDRKSKALTNRLKSDPSNTDVTDELDKLDEKALELVKGLFVDDEDGKQVEELFNSFGFIEIMSIIDQIFNDGKKESETAKDGSGKPEA